MYYAIYKVLKRYHGAYPPWYFLSVLRPVHIKGGNYNDDYNYEVLKTH